LLVFWLLPLIQQFAASPGNLSKIFVFFVGNEYSSVSFSQVMRAVADAIAILPLGQLGYTLKWSGYSILLEILWVCLLVLSTFFAARRSKKYLAVLGLFSLFGLVVAYVSLSSIVGELAPYLTYWISTISISGWIVIACLWGSLLVEKIKDLLPGSKEKLRRVVVAVIIVLVFVASFEFVSIMGEKSITYRTDPRFHFVSQLSESAYEYLQENKIQRPKLVFLKNEDWSIAVGVAAQLYRRGIDFACSPNYSFLFGDRHSQKGKGNGSLYLGKGDSLKKNLAETGCKDSRFIAAVGEYYLHWSASGCMDTMEAGP